MATFHNQISYEVCKLQTYPIPFPLPPSVSRPSGWPQSAHCIVLRTRRDQLAPPSARTYSPIGNDTTTPPGRQNLCHNNQPRSGGMMEGAGNGREGSRERRRVTTYKEGELQSVATGSLLNFSWVWWYSDADSKARLGPSRFTQQAFTALLASRWPRSLGSEWLRSQELRTERTGLVEGCGVD